MTPSPLFNFTPPSPQDWAEILVKYTTLAADWLRPYSTLISLVFLTGIIYCFLRYEQIIAETHHHDHYDHDHDHDGHGEGHGEGHGVDESHDEASEQMGESQAVKQWKRIRDHVQGEKESEWRLAILEADVMLDEMLTGMGYHGDTLGEKLKSVEKSDFTTLDLAWEAHSVRNRIAHEGASFALSQREAKRVIEMFRKVFEEFRYI